MENDPGHLASLAQALGRIDAKLRQARERKLECFGSHKHQFTLNPPVTEADVAAFEAEHQVRLPDEYRAFLTTLGNGGVGPYYGLLPLDAAAAWCEGTLSSPSPLRPGMDTAEVADLPDSGRERLYDGAIELVSQGCSYSSALIVTGAHRGAVLNLDEDLNGPPYFVRDDGFLAWYERWLDELLWGWDGSWFGFGLPGREPDLAAALAAPPYSDRADALQTLARIPRPSGETLARVAECLDDTDATVRERATSLLGRHLGAGPVELLTARLADTDPSVRCAALKALAGREDGPRYLRAALADPVVDVLSTALRHLADKGHLRESDLAPLLGDSRPQVRITAAWYLKKAAMTVVPGGTPR